MVLPLPHVPGVLSAEQVALTADSIVAVQLPSGAIPWFDGGHTDPWDHVQAAMALSVAGRVDEAEQAYAWSRATQRADGSWAIRRDGDDVTDAHTDSNFCAYLATGVWHHWLVTGDRSFVDAMWPTVERGLDAALTMQRADGAVVWASADGVPVADALVTGNASIHLSLRCGVALADLVGAGRPDWEIAAGRQRGGAHRRAVGRLRRRWRRLPMRDTQQLGHGGRDVRAGAGAGRDRPSRRRLRHRLP